MLKNREAYLCLSAMLRAREVKLLSNERCERMLEAPTFEDAAKLLTDCGYEDMSKMGVKEIEKSLSDHKAEIFHELENIVPDKEILDIFKVKYDYHNAKVILKSQSTSSDADYLLSDSGRIPGVQLKSLYLDEKYSSMPGKLGQAMENAASVFSRTTNPQSMDFELDRSYLGEVLDMAKDTGNAFAEGYAKILIDSANLKAAVRTMRMGKDNDFLKTVLIKGGDVDPDRILLCQDKDSLAQLYAHSVLENASVLGGEAIEGGPLTGFELACDNAVNTYLSNAKLVSYGSEPLTAYLAALESEITAVRMILTGRLSGVKSEILKERLRDMYA